MFTRRVLPAVAATAAAALLVTGCGRSESPTEGPEVGAAIDDSPATGDITIWAMGTEGELLPELAEAFEAENPDATVTVTAVPWQDYAKKIETAVAAGDTPDATMIGASDLATFAAGGGLDPVPDDVADASSFYPGAVASTELDGVSYAVPWYVETRSLFYRSDLADEAGVPAPTTWDEYRAFLGGLQDAGAEWGLSLATGAANSWQAVLPFMWQAGAEIYDGEQYVFDSPEAIEGLEYYRSLIADGYVSDTGPVNLGEIEPKFVAGSTSALISGPWELGLLEQAGGADFVEGSVGLAPLPAGPESNASYIGGGHLAVFQDAENRDGAWKLIRWLAQPEVQQQWFEISSDLPAVQSTWDSDALAGNASLSVFREQLETAQAAPTTVTWNEVGAAIDSVTEKLAKGAVTAEEAAAEMQQRADAIGTGTR